MNSKHFIRHTLSSALAVGLLLQSAISFADDTEIFFSSPDTATGVAKPNVLFVLDNSGSMNWGLNNNNNPSGSQPSRLTVLKNTFADIMSNANGINAGIMLLHSKTGTNSRLLHPVIDIDTPLPSSTTVGVPAGGILASADDATQKTNLTEGAAIYDPRLTMGQSVGIATTTLNGFTDITATNQMHFVKRASSNDYACQLNYQTAPNRPTNTTCRNEASRTTYNIRNNQDVTLSFQGLNVPSNATIIRAYLSLTPKNNISTTASNNNRNPELAIDLENSSAHAVLNDNELIGTRTWITRNTRTTGGWRTDTAVEVDVTEQFNQLVNDSSQAIASALFRLGVRTNSSSYDYTICTTLACAPRLYLEYSVPFNRDETNMAALRFQEIGIPQGATVTSATISFFPAANGQGDISFNVKAENSTNPSAFVQGENLQTRPKSSPVIWNSTAADWRAQTTPTAVVGPDVTTLVQGIVNNSNWCGNNAMAFYIEPENGSTGLRSAYSFDGSGGLKPQLNITYTGGETGCINPIVDIRVNTDKDDGRQNTSTNTNAPNLTEQTLALNNNVVAARFDNIKLNRGAQISSAALVLTAANTDTGTHTVTIGVHNTENSPALTTANNNLSSRMPSSNTFTCTLGSNNSWVTDAETTCSSATLAARIQALVNQSNWQPGNAITLLIKSDSSSSKQVVAYERNPGQAIKLRLNVANGGVSTTGLTARQSMIGAIQDLNTVNSTPIVPTLYDAATYLRDPNQTPIESSCQPTHLVLLTDGQANGNGQQNAIRTLIGKSCTGDATDSNEQCGRSLIEFLATTDQAPSLNGDSFVTTHTIGFALDALDDNTGIKKFLQDLATKGGGSFNTADSASELSKAFSKILQEVIATDTTFVSASAPVNTFNRQDNKDELYFSLFRPAATDRWIGNLKRYKMVTQNGNAYIVDQDGMAAIDPLTGFFRGNARSFWSAKNDGNIVADGGAAAKLPNPANRNLLTNVSSNNALTSLNTSNTALTSALLGATNSTERDELITFIRGTSGGVARNALGDPIHATPSLVSYSATEQSAVIGTNEGFVQIFNTNTGVEQSAFMPKELLPNIKRLMANSPTVTTGGGSRQYGMDNTVTIWANDVDADGNISGSNEFVYAYATMGRGGRSIYALDITSPTSPKLKWIIDKNTSGFSRLGQTWSAPVKSKIRVGGVLKDVLIFAGGYDPDQDTGVLDATTGKRTYPRVADDEGNDLFIVDAKDGELIWSASAAGITGMDYSIPSKVSVIGLQVDSTGNVITDPEGTAGQIFVGDMGGQVWRFHINNYADQNESLVTGGLFASIASTGAENARRFYDAPEIAVATINNELNLTVNMGSGYRGHPLDLNIDDRIYSFRTANLATTGGVITESDMVDATNMVKPTSAEIDSIAAAEGWYIRLPNNGEKVFGRPLAINNQLLFNTYEPKSANQACQAAIGTSRAYRVNLLNSGAISNQRSETIVGSTLPPDPQLFCQGNSCWAYNDPSQLIPSTPTDPSQDSCALASNPEKCRCDRDPLCEWVPSTPRTYWTDEQEN